jgi:hypothetical protein
MILLFIEHNTREAPEKEEKEKFGIPGTLFASEIIHVQGLQSFSFLGSSIRKVAWSVPIKPGSGV